MTTYQQGLIDGAKMGAGQVGIALFLMETEYAGTSTQIAIRMGLRPQEIISRISVLHERGFVYHSGHLTTKNGTQPIYKWGPGEPDVPKPKSRNELVIEKTVAIAVKRKTEQEAVLADVARRATKHGTEEVNGAVRTHKMRG